jgi:hypothetical protein
MELQNNVHWKGAVKGVHESSGTVTPTVSGTVNKINSSRRNCITELVRC